MKTKLLLLMALALTCQQAHAYAITNYLEMVAVTAVGGSWKNVSLSNTYTDPVIACTYNLPSVANNEAVVRVQKVGTGFQIKAQRPVSSSAVTASTVYCTVSEAGAYTYPIKYEAHTVSSAGTNYGSNWSSALMENISAAPYKMQNYAQPVVIGQVMSYNNDHFSTFWTNSCGNRNTNPTNTGICVGKHTGQVTPNNPNAETLGYFIAEEAEYFMANAYLKIDLGADSVAGTNNSAPYNYTLPRNYTYATATQSGEDGGNGSWAVFYGNSPVSSVLQLAVEEDTAAGDTTRRHTNEQIAYWAMEPIVKTYADLMINEVMYMQSGTDLREFIELYALSDGSILNYVVSSQDGASQNYYLPNLDVKAGDYVILHSNIGTTSTVGNVHHVYTQSTSTPLANTGDDIVLLKPSSSDVTTLNGSGTVNAIPIDYVSYGSGSTDPIPTSNDGVTVSWTSSDVGRLGSTPAGQSISLTNNANDSDTSVCWEFTGSGAASNCLGYLITSNTDSNGFVHSQGVNNNNVPIITLKKVVETIYDPYNGASNPKAIPGSILEYTITAFNSGPLNADNDTIRIADMIPERTKLCVENNGDCVLPYFVDGSPTSGLTVGSIQYSSDNGTSFNYSPIADGEGTDTSVTHVAAPTFGEFKPMIGTTPPSFSLKFRVMVE
jgi:uncharacterized repeat protein (TIGR01451 family)